MLRANLLDRLLLVPVLLLLSQVSWGQSFPNYSPPPMPTSPFPMNHLMTGNAENPYAREGQGSYQTAAGEWRRAEKLRFDGSKLVVKGATTTKLPIGELRALEISQDTFFILKSLPGRAAAAQRPEALEVAYSHRGTQLLYLYYGGKVLCFLKRPAVPLQLLPTDKQEFKTAMLTIVQSCPAVAAQVADGTLGRREALQIIQAYDACR